MNSEKADGLTVGELPLGIERRTVLRGAVALLGGCAGAPGLAAAALPAPQTAREASVKAGDDAAVADTSGGRVAGYIRNGIFTFKGVPYAQGPTGSLRFQPPVKRQPWSGVRSSRQYGYVAPQAARGGWAHDEEAFMFSWDDGVQDEDCLRINLWTPSLKSDAKRPVLVWLHGGGFVAGSGQELRAYDGENLARRGDVVVVSLNHRLNALGYLDLSRYGDEYSASANLGMLDIVAALQWVRDNIGSFGGDANLVTIFGQSGGGAKVGTLMAMPSAQGLFHRAIVQSGSMLRALSQEKSRELAEAIVGELGLTAATIDRIQSLPYRQILDASEKILRERNPSRPGSALNLRRLADSARFAPVVDGKVLPAHPFDPVASTLSAQVPMIIGTTLNEFVTAIDHPEYELMGVAELEKQVAEVYGEHAPPVLAAFRERTPHAKPFDLWSRIAVSAFRANAIKQAQIKAAQGNAPAYLYWFTWQTPILNGRPRAFHCSEIAFVFDNAERCDSMTGGGPAARALAANMSDAWIRFARTGNPNHPNLPHWPAVTALQAPTMIFDHPPQMLVDPDAAEQRSIAVD